MAISVAIGAAELTWDLLLLSRLPRTFAAILSGASLAISGMVMQLLVRNRFVEPGTIGASEAAILGVLIATIVSPSMAIILKMAVAALFSLTGIAGFMVLARRIPPQQPLLIPLIGLVYSGIIGASATFIAYQTDLLQYLGIWFNGEFSGILAGRYELLWLATIAVIVIYLIADQLTIVGLGENVSRNLGIAYKKMLWIGIVCVSAVTALVVVTVGMLPFVGLVAPNIAARLRGDNLRQNLPFVAMLGASLVLASDVVGRVIRYPYEIPAGTVFGVLGAAVFLYLLFKKPYESVKAVSTTGPGKNA